MGSYNLMKTLNTVSLRRSVELDVKSPIKSVRPSSKSFVADNFLMPATFVVPFAHLMASPLVAQAGVTPSLKNLINSVIAGGVVLAALGAAVSAVANFDP